MINLISGGTLTPIMVIVGWVDMFFIKRWHKEYTEKEPHSPSLWKQFKDYFGVEEKGKEVVTKGKPSITSAIESFYNENELIQDKYRHIHTPQKIREDIFKKTTNNKRKNTGGIIVSVSYSHGIFKDSYQYRHKHIINPRPEIRFNSYFPTISDLSNEQKEWYFYWRTQFLQGTTLKIDLSYLFIFTYELINYSFNQNAAFNISVLEKLYNNYRPLYPKLDNYLPRWIADMLIEVGEEALTSELLDKEQLKSNSKLYEMLESNESLDNVSMNSWNKYIRYGRKSKYFEAKKHKIYEAYKENTKKYQNFKKQEGVELIEHWFKTIEYKAMRNFFNAAVIDRSVSAEQEIQKQIKPKESLQKETTALIKVTENILRKEDKVSGSIKDYQEDLPTGFVQQITTVHESLDSRFIVVKDVDAEQKGEAIPERVENNKTGPLLFDDKRIQSLEKDTAELITTFEKELMQREGENEKEPVAANESSRWDSPLNDLFESGENDSKKFIKALTNIECDFLKLFDGETMYTITEEVALQFGQSKGMMLGVILSNINEKAQLNLQDILIEKDENKLYLVEDFEDVLESIKEGMYEN